VEHLAYEPALAFYIRDPFGTQLTTAKLAEVKTDLAALVTIIGEK